MCRRMIPLRKLHLMTLIYFFMITKWNVNISETVLGIAKCEMIFSIWPLATLVSKVQILQIFPHLFCTHSRVALVYLSINYIYIYIYIYIYMYVYIYIISAASEFLENIIENIRFFGSK